MKVCRSCSAYNRDERTHCVDCGERLGAPLRGEEAQRLEEQLKTKTARLWDGEDPLRITPFDFVVGILSLLAAATGGLLWVFGLVAEGNIVLMISGIILGFFGALECLVPRLMWELEEMRLSLFTHDATPFAGYALLRRIMEGVCLLASVICIVLSVLR